MTKQKCSKSDSWIAVINNKEVNMNKIRFVLVFIALVGIAAAFAQTTPVTVRFYDSSGTNQTKAALDLEAIPLLGAPYTNTFPTSANRWRFQWYKDGGDGIISPLNADGTPGGDDEIATGNTIPGNTQGTVGLAPTGAWTPSGAGFDPAGSSSGNTHVGDRVYIRIFNHNQIASATKSMAFTALYTITSTGLQNISPFVPSYAWGPWVEKPTTPLVSGTITSVFSVTGVSVTCTGLPAYVTTSTGQYNFSVPTGADITIIPSKLGYIFTPPSYTFEDVMAGIDSVDFVMSKLNPNTATNPTPPNSATGVLPYIGQVAWDYIPLDGYALATGFKVYFPDDAPPVLVPYEAGVTHYAYDIPLLDYNTIYGWKVVPTNGYKGAELNPASRGSGSKADAEDIITWSFTTRDAQLITPGFPEPVDPDGAGPLGTFVFNTPSTQEVPGTPVIEYTIVPQEEVPLFPGLGHVTQAFAMNLSTAYPTDHTGLSVTLPAGEWYAIAYYNGAWHEAVPYPSTTGTLSWPDIPFMEDVQIIFSQGYDPFVPVELSSFTAIFSAGFFVELTWVVQSETNHLGYYVLRNTAEDMGTATTLNTSPISSGSNSGEQITYNFRDEQIDANQTYYYWLESVDLDGTSQFFGPISVVVGSGDQEIVPPLIPTVTELQDAYPNPFNPVTTIPYSLKSAGDVQISIYNLKGQLVWSYGNKHDKSGYYKINWNGRDNSGKPVSSGIYYYRMSSGKYTASKKIVLVK